MVVVAVFLGVVLMGGAVVLGIALQMRMMKRAPAAALPAAPDSRAWMEQVGAVRIEGDDVYLRVDQDEGNGTRRGLGPGVPLFFADVRAEGNALVFDYLPGTTRALQRIEVDADVARVFATRLRARFGLPRSQVTRPITFDTLKQNPAAFHGQVVCVQGPWHVGFESSFFANLWMSPLEGGPTHGEVKVTGLVLWSGATRGHGHLGMWEGEIIPFEITQVPDP